MSDDPDADILLLVAEHDLDRALRLLMERHGVAVYRYIHKTLHDEARANDVQQRVFIEAYRDLPRFGGRSTLRTWVFAIARNRVLDAIKQDKRAASHLGESDGADAPDPGPAPDEQLDDARLRDALARCLEKLNEPSRMAVLLRYQQGFSFDEMAEVCREKPGTLQARVMRALPVLRKCIETTTGGAV
ncbi:MAG TPA: sigma-70 family RNA polymerase sigma factor [Kofleriaceae bacterium]|nr:sigma-70 family RNA polymerase sigma factor [Kofleriaceae bacterium]